ncbi:MAG: serine/threonine protein kinase, partial [Woeseiaceae bacterium]
MTNHYKTLQSAFEQALKLEGLEQDAFIESFGVDHPALLEQLRGLLVADAKTDHALAGPIAESADAIASTDGDPWLHRSVGAWKIVDRIADGGMGAVFLAERVDQQYEQQVAIKIMSARLLASDAIERFKAERQILANLSHPYIAQLHDGGATEDDLPYLVMEYIDGLPIDEHCIKHALDIDERLALFVKVCTAVDHAHRNLTVHRDLKPSNILIDQRGDPKLLDFGIAKLLDTQTGEPTDELTRAGGRAMTPQYASPEQVRGEPISVATDVYSLGVLLYRLMTGTSPYGDMTASSVSIEQAILDITPSRPSTLFETTGQPNSDQHLAGNSDRQIRNKLSGDLDTIILKALQKEADRRYPSVAMFAADVGRYLTHQPIE